MFCSGDEGINSEKVAFELDLNDEKDPDVGRVGGGILQAGRAVNAKAARRGTGLLCLRTRRRSQRTVVKMGLRVEVKQFRTLKMRVTIWITGPDLHLVVIPSL